MKTAVLDRADQEVLAAVESKPRRWESLRAPEIDENGLQVFASRPARSEPDLVLVEGDPIDEDVYERYLLAVLRRSSCRPKLIYWRPNLQRRAVTAKPVARVGRSALPRGARSAPSRRSRASSRRGDSDREPPAERACLGCGASLDGAHPNAKWCLEPECRRKQNTTNVANSRTRRRPEPSRKKTRRKPRFDEKRLRDELGAIRAEIEHDAERRQFAWRALVSANGSLRDLAAEAGSHSRQLASLWERRRALQFALTPHDDELTPFQRVCAGVMRQRP